MTFKQRKLPMRTCVACREGGDKRSLVRFVRTAAGDVAVDATGRAPGRGAYLHSNARCFSTAQKTNALARALRVRLVAQDYERLAAEFVALEQVDLQSSTQKPSVQMLNGAFLEAREER